MNKEQVQEAINIEWFDSKDARDRADVLVLLQDLGRYGVAQTVLKEVWGDFIIEKEKE